MKKIIAVVLVALLAFGTPVGASYNDISPTAGYRQAVDNLTAYGVLCGVTEDSFMPDVTLTRAEFSKIAVLVSGSEQKKTGSLFLDVPASHWANSYIGAAAEQKFLIGYPDGTFCPEQPVSYAQAITVTLRLLGYTDDMLSGIWPDNYLEKANELGVTDGMAVSPDAPISRGECAVLLDNALMTNKYQPSSYRTDTLLLEEMGLHLSDTCIVYATKAESAALLENEVLTTDGIYLALKDPSDFLSQKGKLVLNDADEIIHFLPADQTALSTKSSKKSSRVTFSSNSAQIDLDDDTIFFYQGNQLSYQEICDDDDLSWSSKDTIVYLTQSGAVDYVFVAN